MALRPAVDNSDHTTGNDEAVLEIVEFGDYQCPHCGAAHPVIKAMLEEFGDEVKFVFRNFPLSQIHPLARPAALAAEAAAEQGMFWEMHDAIFEQQRRLDESFLLQQAAHLSLNEEQFLDDSESAELNDKVDRDFESGMRSGVSGTPTFFVNGHKFEGSAVMLLNMVKSNAEQ